MTSPLDDFRALLARLPAFDDRAASRVRASLGGRHASLGRVAELGEWIAGVAGRPVAAIVRPAVVLFAGAHALSERLHLDSPAAAASAFVERSGRGAAAINQICAAGDIGLKVMDLALDMPVPDIRREAALDPRHTAATIAFGMEAIAGGADLVVLSTAGTGSREPAAALAALLDGAPVNGAIADAVARHSALRNDPLAALGAIGGREIAALAGAIVAARIERIPVILDGAAALAAARALMAAEPRALDHCLIAAPSANILAGMVPLLELGVEDGEGISGALAIGVVRNALAVVAGLGRQR